MIDFDQLDKTIHEKARLSIMTLLAGRGEWAFQDLKAELGMSGGFAFDVQAVCTGFIYALSLADKLVASGADHGRISAFIGVGK